MSWFSFRCYPLWTSYSLRISTFSKRCKSILNWGKRKSHKGIDKSSKYRGWNPSCPSCFPPRKKKKEKTIIPFRFSLFHHFDMRMEKGRIETRGSFSFFKRLSLSLSLLQREETKGGEKWEALRGKSAPTPLTLARPAAVWGPFTSFSYSSSSLSLSFSLRVCGKWMEGGDYKKNIQLTLSISSWLMVVIYIL